MDRWMNKREKKANEEKFDVWTHAFYMSPSHPMVQGGKSALVYGNGRTHNTKIRQVRLTAGY